MTDISTKKLGLKLGTVPERRFTVDLDKYADTSVVVPTTIVREANALQYGISMLGNDKYGDCVEAAMLNIQATFRLKEGIVPYPWSTQAALELYSHITGFNPVTGSGDNGTDPQQAFQYWRTNGLPGHEIVGYGVLNGDSVNIKRAIYEFGAVLVALALPTTAQSQDVTWVWESNSVAGSWGGHGICTDSYTETDLGFWSWAQFGTMDNAFAENTIEQVLVPLSKDQIGKGGVGPGGFNFSAMQKDLPTLS